MTVVTSLQDALASEVMTDRGIVVACRTHPTTTGGASHEPATYSEVNHWDYPASSMNRRTTRTVVCGGLLVLLLLVDTNLSTGCAAGEGVGAAAAVVVVASASHDLVQPHHHRLRSKCFARSQAPPRPHGGVLLARRDYRTKSVGRTVVHHHHHHQSEASFSTAVTQLCRAFPRGGSSNPPDAKAGGEEEVAPAAPAVVVEATAEEEKGDAATVVPSRRHSNQGGGDDGVHATTTTTTIVHPAGTIVLEERPASLHNEEREVQVSHEEEVEASPHIATVVVVPTAERRPDNGVLVPPPDASTLEPGASQHTDGPPKDADSPSAATIVAGDAVPDAQHHHHHSGTGPILVRDRPTEPPADTAEAGASPPPPPLPRVETIDLPTDAPFVHSASSSPPSKTTTTAFVKRAPRRHPKTTTTTSAARVIRPQRHGGAQPENGHEHVREKSSSQATAAPILEPAPSGSPSRTPLVRTLLAPATLLASATSAILRNPFCLYYLCALIGTSVGFGQFLYLSTVGYAWGVALPVAAAMLRSHRVTHLPSWLVLLWAVRLSAFLLWREYINWPALHAHMQWVPSPPLPTQVLGWLLYSALYWAVASPCWWTLLNAPTTSQHRTPDGTAAASPSSTDRAPPLFHPLGVALQVAGLTLETVADWQKSHFKASHRREWCHVGVWKYSTHPNYLGEGLFWAGTHLSGLYAFLNDRHGRTVASRTGQLVASGIGLSFVASILRGAVLHLRDAHGLKYGSDPLFQTYRENYGLLGYKVWDAYVRRRAHQAAEAATPLSVEAPKDGAAPTEESPAAAQET